MKKCFLYKMTIPSALFISFLIINGCGGGGGSAATTSALTKTVELSGLFGDIDVPFANSSGGRRSMMLYSAQEMKGAGIITSISFKYGAPQATAVSCPNTTIKMSHTNLTNLDGTINVNNGVFANNINTEQGSQQPVLTSSTVNIPVGAADSYYTIPLTTPFSYNGVDNLVVEITHTACTGDVWTANHGGTGALVTLENAGATATTGYARDWLPDTKFNLSGGDNAITYTADGYNSYPFDNSNGRKIQLLYTAAEINGSGIITGIAFPVHVVAAGPATVTVKLGHTSFSALTTTFAANFNSGAPVTVANTITFNIPAGVPDGDYVWIPLPDDAFSYDGIHNLVVEIEVSALTGAADWRNSNTSGISTRLFGNVGDLAGTLQNNQYFIKFRFAGGPVDVIVPGTVSDTTPFTNNASGSIRQILYLASELGAKGTITKVAHRIVGDSLAGSYGSFTVSLANTDNTTLDTTFANNMTGGSTVYSVTSFPILSGLKYGDWIEIPLSTPFVIDPTKNLVVQMSAASGTAGNGTRIFDNASRYTKRRASAIPLGTTGSTSNYIADLRLVIQ